VSLVVCHEGSVFMGVACSAAFIFVLPSIHHVVSSTSPLLSLV
jgi:hypothetical protein